MDTKKSSKKPFAFIAFGIVTLCVGRLVAAEIFFHPTVTVYDVGQGDALHFRLSGGMDILIDGGPDDTVLQQLGSSMPWYDHTLDLLVMTHSDADHLSGLVEVIRRYDVRMIIVGGGAHPVPLFDALQTLAKESNIEIHALSKDEQFVVNEGVFTFFQPQLPPDASENNRSVVTRFQNTYGSFLLTGDIELPTENALLQQKYFLSSDILKAGHHGSKTSTSEPFLRAVAPSITVISVGRENRYGHPNAEVLERLQNIKILRTDQEGSITFPLDKPFLP